MRILVVDDTDAVLLLLMRFVEALGHVATPARNGQEAVDSWRREHPDLILMDMMMPVMSGVDAAAIIKEEAGENWVPIVFVTGVGEESILAEAIERGADDYINKPVNFRVLEAKLKAINRTLELNRKVREQSARLADYFDRSEEEKRVVRHLMEQMVNVERLADPLLEYWLSPAESLSGDLIAAARTPGRVLHVMLADGIGHGITAALNVLPLTQPFYSMSEKGYGISDILVEMNNKVRQVLPIGRFVAVALISINEADQCVEIWNGGMPTLQLLDAAGKVFETCKSFSLPLGVVPSQAMEFMPSRYYFNQPGTVMAYSDGLVEARNPDADCYGLPRLLEAVEVKAGVKQLDAIQTSLGNFLGPALHHDDVSLVLARFGQSLTEDLLDSAHAPEIEKLRSIAQLIDQHEVIWRYSLLLGVEELKYINTVPFMMTFVNNVHTLDACQSDVFLILTELFVNGLDHGILKLDSSLKQESDGMEHYLVEKMRRLDALEHGYIEIDLAGIKCEGRTVLKVRVRDSGEGFDWPRLYQNGFLSLPQERGLGLVNSLCLGVQYVGSGNEVIAYYSPRNS